MDDTTRSLLAYLPLIIVVLLLIRRTQRPRILHPVRIWLGH